MRCSLPLEKCGQGMNNELNGSGPGHVRALKKHIASLDVRVSFISMSFLSCPFSFTKTHVSLYVGLYPPVP